MTKDEEMKFQLNVHEISRKTTGHINVFSNGFRQEFLFGVCKNRNRHTTPAEMSFPTFFPIADLPAFKTRLVWYHLVFFFLFLFSLQIPIGYQDHKFCTSRKTKIKLVVVLWDNIVNTQEHL